MSIRMPIFTGSNGSPWPTMPRVGGYTTIDSTAFSPIRPPPWYHFSLRHSPVVAVSTPE